MKKRILVVDDETSIVDVLKFNLEKNGYEVVVAFDGEQALEKLQHKKIDCILLDIMMPNISGLEVCRIVRSTPSISTTPIIMLSAKSEETDKVIGLGIGADDYITKPFSIRELFARIEALIRRSDNLYRLNDIYSTNHFMVSSEELKIVCDDKELDLTPLEFEILKLLIENTGTTVLRNELLAIKSDDDSLNSRSLDVHMSKIRKKIKQINPEIEAIKTIRGKGYLFND
ncbi:MAG TPA: response regulator transcription factor [Erysipelothrix sp.]|nr:response regulator transcription factor [Erysipelothrix sp.]